MSRNTFILLGLLTGSVAMIGCSKNITAPSVETDRQAQTLTANGCGPMERELDNIQLDQIEESNEVREYKKTIDAASAGRQVGVIEVGADELSEYKKATQDELPEFKKTIDAASAGRQVGVIEVGAEELPEFEKKK